MIKIIAEIGINHNGDIEIAKRLIQIAAAAGCDYVKFQKRTPDLCVPEEQRNKPRETPWGVMPYIEYKHRIEFGEAQYMDIAKACNLHGIGWFASVWDIQAAQFMANIGCKTVKVPSAKITELPLLQCCRRWFETYILSTGMSTEDEIERALETSQPDYVLHTHSAYPAPSGELNLKYIEHLKEKYPKVQIGYSGHEYGLTTTFAAAALGTAMIERHVTLDRNMWGSDQLSSVEPVGLFKLVSGIRTIEKALGVAEDRIVLESEKAKRKSLRGL